MRSLRPCSDLSATPSFPSQPEGNPAGTLRSESEMERKPEVPASNPDEALFHFVKPSGRDEGLLLLYGLESNPESSLQTPQEA